MEPELSDKAARRLADLFRKKPPLTPDMQEHANALALYMVNGADVSVGQGEKIAAARKRYAELCKESKGADPERRAAGKLFDQIEEVAIEKIRHLVRDRLLREKPIDLKILTGQLRSDEPTIRPFAETVGDTIAFLARGEAQGHQYAKTLVKTKEWKEIESVYPEVNNLTKAERLLAETKKPQVSVQSDANRADAEMKSKFAVAKITLLKDLARINEGFLTEMKLENVIKTTDIVIAAVKYKIEGASALLMQVRDILPKIDELVDDPEKFTLRHKQLVKQLRKTITAAVQDAGLTDKASGHVRRTEASKPTPGEGFIPGI